jgi:pimeloyl-ACP methyl ester carboxylesterase
MPLTAAAKDRPALIWPGRAAPLVGCLLLIFLLTGCGTTKFLTVRRVPKSPLEGPLQLVSYKGPQPSERTEQLLRRYALVDAQKRAPEEVLTTLQNELDREPTPDKVYSFAELAFIAAKRAEHRGDDSKALDYYAASVAHAYLYLFSPNFDRFRNPYDPLFRRACDLYNGSLEGALRLANKRGALQPGKAEVITTGKLQYHVNIVVRGPWRAEDIERLEFVNDYEIQGGLTNHYHTYGLGVPMIAVRRKDAQSDAPNEKYYPGGLSFATTAFLRVMPPAQQSDTQVRQCVLELHDPLASSDIQIGGRVAPLETDLTVPLAYFLDSPEFKETDVATWGLLTPDAVQGVKGLYMIEPYDPRRIPVVMVHGLWSSPLTWMEMFNDLRAFPEIRDRYQFWFYLYPTGQPFWESAAQMRETLAEVRQRLDPTDQKPVLDQMVLVGHSMGGLVSRMQTIESGDDFWHILSDRPLTELQADEQSRARLARIVYFHPNPSIKRVITLGTPHQGSDFANAYTRWAGSKLISLPEMMVQLSNKVTRDNPGFFRDTLFLTCSTSIDSLSPSSPVFPVMLNAQRAPWVKYHNIVGVLSNGGFATRFSGEGDGVVSYKSAHADDAESELIVDAEHMSVHRNSKATLEVRRILIEHWEASAPALVGSGVMPRFQTARQGEPVGYDEPAVAIYR